MELIITLNVDISVEVIEGVRPVRPEELALADLLRLISVSSEEPPNTWDTVSDESGRTLAKMTEVPKVTGLVIRDTSGTPLVQTGTAIRDD